MSQSFDKLKTLIIDIFKNDKYKKYKKYKIVNKNNNYDN